MRHEFTSSVSFMDQMTISLNDKHLSSIMHSRYKTDADKILFSFSLCDLLQFRTSCYYSSPVKLQIISQKKKQHTVQYRRPWCGSAKYNRHQSNILHLTQKYCNMLCLVFAQYFVATQLLLNACKSPNELSNSDKMINWMKACGINAGKQVALQQLISLHTNHSQVPASQK